MKKKLFISFFFFLLSNCFAQIKLDIEPSSQSINSDVKKSVQYHARIISIGNFCKTNPEQLNFIESYFIETLNQLNYSKDELNEIYTFYKTEKLKPTLNYSNCIKFNHEIKNIYLKIKS